MSVVLASNLDLSKTGTKNFTLSAIKRWRKVGTLSAIKRWRKVEGRWELSASVNVLQHL